MMMVKNNPTSSINVVCKMGSAGYMKSFVCHGYPEILGSGSFLPKPGLSNIAPILNNGGYNLEDNIFVLKDSFSS